MPKVLIVGLTLGLASSVAWAGGKGGGTQTSGGANLSDIHFNKVQDQSSAKLYRTGPSGNKTYKPRGTQTTKASTKVIYDKNSNSTKGIKLQGIEGESQDDKHRDEIH